MNLRALHWKKALGIAVFAALSALVVLVYVRNPYENVVGFCVVNALTGFYCPGCGGTRAVYSLLHLDIPGALRMNAMLTVLLPVLAYLMVSELLSAVFGRYLLPELPVNPNVAAVLGGLFLLFGILRNLPALSFLAPG